MKYKAENYIGKNIQLYPGDTYSKFGIIVNVDDLGWTIKITNAHERSDYELNKEYFFNHSTNLKFKFM